MASPSGFSESGESLAEFTVKAVVTGVVLGVVFGAANAYLGLRVGMTVSASIPAAVMAVAVFRLLRMPGTILEANLAQTIGSASTSLASGTIFTIPALFMWSMAPPYLQVVVLCFLGGVLGLAAMIPLRRLLIVREHETLPFPEGTACAEVLHATAAGSSKSAWIFYGIGVGVLVKLLLSIVFLMPSEIRASIGVLPRAELAVELAPALLAVGFILGYRPSAVIVSGALISAMVITPLIAWLGGSMSGPLFPETSVLVKDMSASQIWSKYVRYVGAGAVAAAGILTVIKNLPSMVGAVSAVAKGVKSGGAASVDSDRRDRDLPLSFTVLGVSAVVLVSGLVPGVFAGGMPLGARLLCALGVAVFGILFVAVAARIVGIVGVSSQPTSGITLVTLLAVASVFVAMGWKDPSARAAVLTVGTIVAVAASKAGDISQDLKTGFLVGATPARQQLGQLIGASVACWAVAGTVLMLGSAYTFGSKEIPAPQATLMKTIIEGVLSGDLPKDLVLSGCGLSIAAMLCGVSGLAFAIGVYLPLATMAPIYLGGCVRAFCEQRRRRTKVAAGSESTPAKGGDSGILAASGVVAGEGLAGILVAALVAGNLVRKSVETTVVSGVAGEILTAVSVVLVGLFFARASGHKAS